MSSKRGCGFSSAVLLLISGWSGLAGNSAASAQAGSLDWGRHAVTWPESIWSVEAVDAHAVGFQKSNSPAFMKLFGSSS